ncbi:MAG: type II toxin-antitoxin system VapC family toxin [Bacillota bacterium]
MIGQEPNSSKYAVDTNIIIYVLKGVGKAIEIMEQFEEDGADVYFSTIVEAELFSFHELNSEQKARIRGILEIGEIIDVDSETALKAAELRAFSRKVYQRKLKLPDAIIAATALLHSAILVTRNFDDFSHLVDYGLSIWDPFKGSVGV